jgi:mannosyl-3-phosphoglycerate phosphatase family protein
MDGKVIIISDMDGCILDETYSYLSSLNIIKYIYENNYLLILNTSKTRSEIKYYLDKWGLWDKEYGYVVENGAAIHLSLSTTIPNIFFKHGFKHVNHEYVLVNGLETLMITKMIGDIIEKTRGKALWLHDLTPQYFSKITGLPIELAVLALRRDYSQIFHPLNKSIIRDIIREINSRGLRVSTGSGIIYSVTGDHDKGTATSQLTRLFDDLYDRKYVTIGVGDGLNDLPMLRVTDYSIILGCRKELVEGLKDKEKVYVSCSKGPKAWINMVKKVVMDLTRQ